MIPTAWGAIARLTRPIRRFNTKLDTPAVVVFTLAAFAGMGLYTFVSAFLDRSPPIDYLAASAASKSVPVGGTIDIHFDVYRYRICNVTKVNRILTDSQGVMHVVSNYTTATLTRPGRESYDRTITIPEAVAPGPAIYRISIWFACNWVHNLGWPIFVSSPPVTFRVTPSETEGLHLPPLPEQLQP